MALNEHNFLSVYTDLTLNTMSKNHYSLLMKSCLYVIQWLGFSACITFTSPRGGISKMTEKGDTAALFLHVINSGDYKGHCACHTE